MFGIYFHVGITPDRSFKFTYYEVGVAGRNGKMRDEIGSFSIHVCCSFTVEKDHLKDFSMDQASCKSYMFSLLMN